MSSSPLAPSLSLLLVLSVLQPWTTPAHAQTSCLGAPVVPIACDGTDTRSNDLSDVVETTPCSMVNSYPGGETTYEFLAPRTENVTVDLTGIQGFEAGDPDLFVLTSDGMSTCGACVAESTNVGTTPEQITFAATEGETYFFMVNGFADGVVGDYTIDVTCGGGGGGNGTCTPAATLVCGATDSRSNDGAGSTDQIDAYACGELGGFDYSGPEVAYTFVAPRTEQVTATLTEATSSLDLALLEGAVCAAADCVDGTVIDGGTAIVSFAATQGSTYHLVVDGFQGAISDYTLELACEGGVDDPIFGDDFESGDTGAWTSE